MTSRIQVAICDSLIITIAFHFIITCRSEFPMILVGNKSDLEPERTVSRFKIKSSIIMVCFSCFCFVFPPAMLVTFFCKIICVYFVQVSTSEGQELASELKASNHNLESTIFD